MRSLSAKLLMLLTVALLPLGLIAVYQTNYVVQEAKELTRRDMLSRTLEAAQAQVRIIRQAYGAAYALGAAAAVLRADQTTCTDVMRRFSNSNNNIVFAGFVQADGVMSCTSTGEPVDVSSFDSWKSFERDPRPMIEINTQDGTPGRTLLIASVPIFDNAGNLLGAGTVSMPHSLVDVHLQSGPPSLEMALIGFDGRRLSASPDFQTSETVQEFLAETNLKDIPSKGRILELPSIDDERERTVAFVPLSVADAVILGRWSVEAMPQSVTFLGTAAPLFPIAMWAAGLFVAFFAMERLVLSHLRALRGHMRRFSVDELKDSYVQIPGAPSEIVEIAESYNALLDRITSNMIQLNDNVREKDILLKEIHHRVKNNLQLIASILNMQIRQVRSADARSVLERVQDRVMSLASIHKLLYTDTKVDVVRADHLLSEIARNAINVGAKNGVGVETDMSFSPVELDPDQAVPLALLVTEAITNALKYGIAGVNGEARLSVTLREDEGGLVHLTVVNAIDMTNIPEDDLGTGLGARLIAAFVSQLGGTSRIEKRDGNYVFELEFVKLLASDRIQKAA